MEHRIVVFCSWVFLTCGIAMMLASLLGLQGGGGKLFSLGAIFAGVGFGIMAHRMWFERKKTRLKQSGKLIQAQFLRVELNPALEVQGANPFRIVAQWHDVRNNSIFVFRSASLWFDPTQFVQARSIPVYVDPEDPNYYFVDLSFLPKHRP